jgi:DNA-binding NarL/FixJ family response regulator
MARRVFIVWANPLFFDTLRLLLAQSEIEVVGESSAYARVPGEIEKLRPDVVVVEETEQNRAEGITSILHMLDTCSWCPNIVRMSLQDNEIWVYHREQWTINRKEEMLQIIGGSDDKSD